MLQLLNYINGEMQPPLQGKYLECINPALNEPFARVPDSGADDMNRAIQAAHAAFADWSSLSPKRRSDYLLAIARLIEENLQPLAEAESLDNGKPVSVAKTVDIPRAAANFHFYGTAILHSSSESYYMEEQPAINYVLRRPVGVAACISPWNLPLYLFTWKIAPALAAGCTVVAKPSEVTPYTAYLLSEICQKAGLPPGVLNIVHGTGPTAGQALVKHPLVKAISFTGSTRAGKQIASLAAPEFKKLSLELGGKNPSIVFEDCEWDVMLASMVKSSFSNQGQICLCGSRILVQEGIYQEFKSEFVKEVASLKVGDPSEKHTDIGALVSREHFEKVLSYIELAKQEGGTILTGGKVAHVTGRCAKGFFIEPTVIEGLGPNCRTNQEEIFGPVVTLQSFKDSKEAIKLANAVPYGLSATIWTSDLNRAHRVAHAIEAGIVWVNSWMLRDLRTPFGGAKQSGMGREGGFEALRFFTEEKNVCIKL